MIGRCRPDLRLPLLPLDPDSPEGRNLGAILKDLREGEGEAQ